MRSTLALVLTLVMGSGRAHAEPDIETPPPAPPPPAQPPPAQPPRNPVSEPISLAADDAAPSRPAVELQARLMMGAQEVDVHPHGSQLAEDNRQPFFLEQARVELDFIASKVLSGSFGAELRDKPAVRDAYVNVELARAFQIRAGHFKRPISRTALTRLGKLPFRDRGLFDHDILRDQHWGHRALGVMLWGKLKPAHFKWHAALMNANPTVDVAESARIGGADALGRVEYAPLAWLSVGLNGGYKRTEEYAGGPDLDMFAFGGDARVHAGPVRVVLESTAAQTASPPPGSSKRNPFAANAMGYTTYDLSIAPDVVLQPTLLGEWYDADTADSGDQALRGVLGVNLLLFDRRYRVLPQVEIVRTLDDDDDADEALVELERYYVLLSAEL
jgi:hypothetical protein